MNQYLMGLVMGAALAVPAWAADWPSFRGPDHNGVSSEKGWLGAWPGGQPKMVWKKAVGTGFSSMTVAEGRLYTLGNAANADTIYCFDAGNGAEVWKFAYPQKLDPKYYDGGPSSTPTIAGGKVYSISKQGDVHCLDAASGREVWHRNVKQEFGLTEPEWGFAGSPFVEGDRVFLNAGSHGVALDRATGDKVWVSGPAAAGYSSPVPVTHAGTKALALMASKALVIVDPKSGNELARFPWVTQYDVNAPDPVLVGGDFLITSGYKFQEESGTGASSALLRPGASGLQKIWQSRELASQLSTPVYLNGYIYGFTGSSGDSGHLRCLDARTGEVKWSSPEVPVGNLMAADGKLIAVAGNGELIVVAAQPSSYQEITRAQVAGGKCWSAPVMSNGRLYVRNSKGEVFCVDVKGTGPVS